MKVMTFNIRCANDKNGNSIAERAPRLKVVLDRYNADLVGFQEATPAWMEHIEAYYGADYEIFNQYRSSTNFESTPMMWKKDKFECLDKGYFWLSDAPDIESQGWDIAGCKRICLWAKLKELATGVVFVYFNTHYGFGDPCQVASSKLIIAHAKEMGMPAAVLTADFNMNMNAPGYKELRTYFADVNDCTAKDPGTTYHGYRLEHTGSLIDFCFVTPETVRCISSKRITDLVDGMFPSDHYGVLSEIELRQPLSIMTFNVLNCSPGAEKPEERARWARALIRKYTPSIVGFQEVTPVILEKLEKMNSYEHAIMYRGENSKEATPIFWRKADFEKLEEEHFWLSETPEKEGLGFGGHYLRICTMVVLRHKNTGKKIVHFNTHFDFGDDCHVKSANLLRERAARYAGCPTFFTADFNMHIGGAGYRAMREFAKDARWEVAPQDFTPTLQNLDADFSCPSIIDFVFTNGAGIELKTYRVLQDRHKGQFISDHNPVLVTFLLENEA